MTYDETWDDAPARRLPLAAIAVVVALGALLTSSYVLYRQSRVVDSERSARRAEIGRLEKQVTLLQSRGAALAGRVGSAEKTLQRRDRGIAPLASRVLKSVFTVETERGLGSGFIAKDGNTPDGRIPTLGEQFLRTLRCDATGAFRHDGADVRSAQSDRFAHVLLPREAAELHLSHDATSVRRRSVGRPHRARRVPLTGQNQRGPHRRQALRLPRRPRGSRCRSRRLP